MKGTGTWNEALLARNIYTLDDSCIQLKPVHYNHANDDSKFCVPGVTRCQPVMHRKRSGETFLAGCKCAPWERCEWGWSEIAERQSWGTPAQELYRKACHLAYDLQVDQETNPRPTHKECPSLTERIYALGWPERRGPIVPCWDGDSTKTPEQAKKPGFTTEAAC